LAVAARWPVTSGVMRPPTEDKLLLLLTEIRADIRQINPELQSLLLLLIQQQRKPTPPPPSISDDTE
jgi:hypothetical protein